MHMVRADASARSEAKPTGCPCGCQSRPRLADDPDCIRHRPPRLVEWGSCDVVTLGLAPHDRETCARCRAVAS